MDPRQEDAIHNERHIKVICIGAGASGLCLAYKLQRSFRNYTLTVRMKFDWKKSDLEEIILTIFF
jgi:aspartate oxidase